MTASEELEAQAFFLADPATLVVRKMPRSLGEACLAYRVVLDGVGAMVIGFDAYSYLYELADAESDEPTSPVHWSDKAQPTREQMVDILLEAADWAREEGK